MSRQFAVHFERTLLSAMLRPLTVVTQFISFSNESSVGWQTAVSHPGGGVATRVRRCMVGPKYRKTSTLGAASEMQNGASIEFAVTSKLVVDQKGSLDPMGQLGHVVP